MAQGPNKSVSTKTRLILWARGAGRCYYCNRDLIGDLISLSPQLVKGLVAHIVAEKPDGPRGDPIRSPLLVDNVDNLMLMCHDHHRLIDEEKPQEYPESRLLAMKQAHERRIQVQSAITQDKATRILRYGARIGFNEPLVDLSGMHNAVFPGRYPETLEAIDLEIVGCQFSDHEPEYWSYQQENLRRQFDGKVRGRIEKGELRHVSVFALAPQPLLIELGRQLCDIVPADVYQRHREPATWAWPTDGAEVQFELSRPSSKHREIALKLGVSASITDERITDVLGSDVSIWSLSAENGHNDCLKAASTLRAFRQHMRRLFDDIKLAHGERATINVFSAMPVALAVELGRVWMPKADLPMRIFDQNKSRGRFISTLEIQAPKAP